MTEGLLLKSDREFAVAPAGGAARWADHCFFLAIKLGILSSRSNTRTTFTTRGPRLRAVGPKTVCRPSPQRAEVGGGRKGEGRKEGGREEGGVDNEFHRLTRWVKRKFPISALPSQSFGHVSNFS